jgi:hypothetical protein
LTSKASKVFNAFKSKPKPVTGNSRQSDNRYDAAPRDITSLGPEELTNIAGYLEPKDLKNMRLAHSKFQAPAERNMELRLKNRQSNVDYAESPNFGKGRQARRVIGATRFLNDEQKSLIKQQGKKPIENPPGLDEQISKARAVFMENADLLAPIARHEGREFSSAAVVSAATSIAEDFATERAVSEYGK